VKGNRYKDVTCFLAGDSDDMAIIIGVHLRLLSVIEEFGMLLAYLLFADLWSQITSTAGIQTTQTSVLCSPNGLTVYHLYLTESLISIELPLLHA
jgi:hypothetical protein